MPLEMMCFIVAISLAHGYAPGDYFVKHGWWYFHLNNPKPHKNDLTKN
jgi:hypothetical protein